MTSSKTRHRIERLSSTSLGPWRSGEPKFHGERLAENAILDCGWGNLIFAHTFADNETLAAAILEEAEGRRNLALYLRDPHVVLAIAPQQLFLDPSHTYRLWLAKYLPSRVQPQGFMIRRLQREADAGQIHRLLVGRGMISAEPDFIWRHRKSKILQFFVAVDPNSSRVIGTVTGIDHAEAFSDPENGSSMWCLAVDPQAPQPGIGRALVAHVADHFAARGRAFMDLSVMHDNSAVIELYENLGFERVQAFCIKTRNVINQSLYMGRRSETTELNPYAQIIVDEALRRGIAVEVLDADYGYFALVYGGRTILCRESLSELTSAVAMSRCDNKIVTHRVLSRANVSVPEQQKAADRDDNLAFLKKHGALVVKPVRGEQGTDVSVNISDPEELEQAVEQARSGGGDAILERFVSGQDLRIVLIDFQVVAAALRRPPTVVGTGRHTVRELIEKQSRRREAATDGESRIPIDEETRRCLKSRGHDLDEVLEKRISVQVRETANLHTGGTLHDVTDRLSPSLHDAARRSALALGIPVVGLDLMVDSVEGEEYVVIEANERPGLANHEPQPTAERFIDLLFPQTVAALSA